MSETPRMPELMSPAGHWPQLHAALEAGADAVYFGLQRFSARAKVGFDAGELPEVVAALHERAVRAYVTVNTLVFDDELRALGSDLERIAAAGADAVIVQDLAAAALANAVAPDLEVHASTQMSITSAEGAALAQRFGCRRVVLGRELSLHDIGRIRRDTDVELEVFVHGALCVSYSGQCFSSEAWGGRSANRGQCAQACRLPYELLVDGAPRDLGPYRYLLSPGDLMAVHQVPELARIGVDSLKIEGRYKDADYVALATAAYRQALDALAGEATLPDRARLDELAQVYSRGSGPYFLTGTDHQAVVRGRAPGHRGLRLGRVTRVDAAGVEIRTEREVRPGDGVVFDAAAWRSPAEPEEGGAVVRVEAGSAPGHVRLGFLRGAVDHRRIRTGDLLWRTRDPATHARARRYTQAADPVRTHPVAMTVHAELGRPLRLVATDHRGLRVEVSGVSPLQRAQRHPLDEAMLRRTVGRLGGTPFHLGRLELHAPTPVFVPVSELNALRREAVADLRSRRRGEGAGRNRRAGEAVPAATSAAPSAATSGPAPGPRARPAPDAAWRLHLLVRTPAQFEAALPLRPASLTLDYLDLYGLRPSVERARDAGAPVRVASPRILKPVEQNVLHFLRSLAAPVLVRSPGLLAALSDLPAAEQPTLYGDFGLNAANAIAAEAYLAMGLRALTPTHDLNARQVAALARSVGAERLEVIGFQHLPVFHTEHCVFCRFLSDGHDFRDCGHPCERHALALRDGNGRAHPVMADVGCRNTVFGAEAQVAAWHLPAWHAVGLRDLRLEFVHEGAGELEAVVEAFRVALPALGGATAAARAAVGRLERALADRCPAGVTEGSLFVPPDGFGGFEGLPPLPMVAEGVDAPQRRSG